MAWHRGTDKMGSWWAGTGRVRVKIVNNVHGHLRSHNLGQRIMRCSFLARRLVVCLERVTTATIKQYDPKKCKQHPSNGMVFRIHTINSHGVGSCQLHDSRGSRGYEKGMNFILQDFHTSKGCISEVGTIELQALVKAPERLNDASRKRRAALMH
jgi:hypothetical protein